MKSFKYLLLLLVLFIFSCDETSNTFIYENENGHHITSVAFAIQYNTYVSIIIYDNMGTVIEVLVDDILDAGSYSIEWNTSNISSGLYQVKMEIPEEYISIQKILYIK